MSSPVFIVNLTLYQINGVLNWSLITTGRSEPNANVKKRLKKKDLAIPASVRSLEFCLCHYLEKTKILKSAIKYQNQKKKVVMETIDPINFMGDLFILIIP